MADKQAHLRQYWHNRALIPQLPPSHHDWMVTVAFYCCVHLVDAVLATEGPGYHPVDHKTRNRAMANIRRLEYIALNYDPLYNLVRKVRYFANPAIWVPLDCLDRDVFRRYVYRIEHSAFKLLQMPQQHEMIKLPTPPASDDMTQR